MDTPAEPRRLNEGNNCGATNGHSRWGLWVHARSARVARRQTSQTQAQTGKLEPKRAPQRHQHTEMTPSEEKTKNASLAPRSANKWPTTTQHMLFEFSKNIQGETKGAIPFDLPPPRYAKRDTAATAPTSHGFVRAVREKRISSALEWTRVAPSTPTSNTRCGKYGNPTADGAARWGTTVDYVLKLSF